MRVPDAMHLCAVLPAVLRLKIQEDLVQLRALADRRRELRRLLQQVTQSAAAKRCAARPRGIVWEFPPVLLAWTAQRGLTPRAPQTVAK
jgi:hypothetical protein